MFFKKKKKEVGSPGVIVANNPTSNISEQYRTIRTNIQFSIVDQKLNTLLVTSATPSSGKSTTSANLAAAFASEGIKVLVVSTDLRKPSLHKIFDENNTVGLTNLLTNPEVGLEQVIKKTFIPNLYRLPSGPVPPNPSELLSSNRMNQIIEEMKTEFDLVVFDSPPLLPVTDAQILAAKVDGTIVVVPQGEVKKNELNQAAELLEKVNANVLGTVMNKVERDSDNYYYYNYYGEE